MSMQIRVVKYRKKMGGSHQTEYAVCTVYFEDLQPVSAFPVVTASDAMKDLKTLIVELWGATQTPPIEFPDVVDFDDHTKHCFPLTWKRKPAMAYGN